MMPLRRVRGIRSEGAPIIAWARSVGGGYAGQDFVIEARANPRVSADGRQRLAWRLTRDGASLGDFRTANAAKAYAECLVTGAVAP